MLCSIVKKKKKKSGSKLLDHTLWTIDCSEMEPEHNSSFLATPHIFQNHKKIAGKVSG